MAAEEIGSFSSVEVIDESSEGVLLDADFEPIEEHGDKLLHVLLHHDVDRFPERLVGDAEGRGGKVQARRSLKIAEDALDLMKDVIIDWSFLRVQRPHCWLLIIDSQQKVPEVAVHEELLDHGVHVADIAQILHTGIASGRALVDFSRVRDLNGADAGVDGIEGLSDHLVSEILVVFANFKDELVNGLPRWLLLARGLTTEEAVFPQELHLPLRHCRSQVEIRQ